MYTKKRPPLKNEVTTRQAMMILVATLPYFKRETNYSKRRRLDDNCDVVFESKDSNQVFKGACHNERAALISLIFFGGEKEALN